MKKESEIINYRFIRKISTNEIISELAPVYAEDWPYRYVPPDQPLIRYMDFWKLEDLFKTHELHFCRADKFSDTLEGTISSEDIHGTSASDLAFEKTVNTGNTSYEKMCENREVAKASTFINCWHINTEDSHKMWDTYTTSSHSAVIITSAGLLNASLKMPVYGSGVKYISKDSPRTEFDVRSLFFYKDTAYEFEKEFRLLIDLLILKESIRRDHPDDFFRRVPVDLSTLVYGIQLHPSATQETKDKVNALIMEYLPKLLKSKGTPHP